MAQSNCPHCKQPISDEDALLCLYCGESLRRGARHSIPLKFVFLAIVAVLVASFLLSLVR